MHYLLLNQDTPLLEFACNVDEYGEENAKEIAWLSEQRPLGYKTLSLFLERRKAPKHRKHIEELLRQAECETLQGFLQVTHALSLNDTYWVKQKKSPLVWADVSLYQNDFNVMIAQAAFDGGAICTRMSSTSPEFGTDGYFAKCWVREKNGVVLYKTGSDTYEVEPLSEYLASQVADALGIDHVPYDLEYYHGRLASVCPLFTSEKTGLAKAYDVIPEERSIVGLLHWFDAIGSGEKFRQMCVLDALILNVDRHLGNFGVLYETDTLKIMGMAPIYDNNRSLLYDLDEEQLAHPDWYLKRLRPRLGSDFVAVARGLLTDTLRRDLTNLQGFTFQQHPKIKVEQRRLDALGRILNSQIEAILVMA